jgi:3-hydroxyisobutyrate dehydrogenase-like beta-hydroxyacid dehydrogenase
MTNIAFLGTGLLGSAFVEASLARGNQITVWNRSIEKTRPLEKLGARVAHTPADAVKGAKYVHLVLKDDPVVEEIVAALRPGLDSGAVIIDHTTTQPRQTAERATRLNAEGVRYLHCPVFIGPAAARQAKGTILASGPRRLFDEVKDYLRPAAEKLEYLGERPDLAAVMKLCGNAFIIGLNGLVSDVFAVATGADVSSAQALKILELFNPAAVIAGRGRNMIARDYVPSFELEMARKDIRLMLETAGDQPLSVLPCVASRMDALIAAGHGGDDLAVMGKDAIHE